MSSPVFSDDIPSTPQLVDTVKSFEAAILPNSKPISINDWETNLNSLRSEINKLKSQSFFKKKAVSAPFDIADFAVDVINPGMMSPPVYATVRFIQGFIDIARDAALRSVDIEYDNSVRNLAHSMMNEFSDERDIPISALFPVGNSRLAKESISECLRLLKEKYIDLPDTAKSILFERAARALENIVDTQQFESEIRLSDDDAETIRADSENFYKLSLTILKDSKSTLKKAQLLSQKMIDLMEKIESDRAKIPDAEEELKRAAKSLIEATGVANEAIRAMQVMGLSDSAAQTLNTINTIVRGGAQIFLGINGDPLSAIQGAATLINGLFGTKNDPDAMRHKQIIEMLGALAKQNQTILNNQKIMADMLGTVIVNQGYIVTKLIQNSQETYVNRMLIITTMTGDISKLESFSERKPELFGDFTSRSRKYEYDNLYRLYDYYPDVLFKGLTQIETILSEEPIHRVLLLKTYNNGQYATLQDGEGKGSFRLENTELGNTLEKYQKRWTNLKKGKKAINNRLLTEYATIEMLGYFYEDDNDPLDMLTEPNLTKYLDLGLINTNLLLRLCKLGINFHNHFQFAKIRGNSFELKTQEELLNTYHPSERGFLLLEKLMTLLNISIAQHIIMSERYEMISYFRYLNDFEIEDIGVFGKTDAEVIELNISANSYISAGGTIAKIKDGQNEIVIKAPHSGFVRKVLYQKGDLVEDSKPIVEMQGKRPRGKPISKEDTESWSLGSYGLGDILSGFMVVGHELKEAEYGLKLINYDFNSYAYQLIVERNFNNLELGENDFVLLRDDVERSFTNPMIYWYNSNEFGQFGNRLKEELDLGERLTNVSIPSHPYYEPHDDQYYSEAWPVMDMIVNAGFGKVYRALEHVGFCIRETASIAMVYDIPTYHEFDQFVRSPNHYTLDMHMRLDNPTITFDWYDKDEKTKAARVSKLRDSKDTFKDLLSTKSVCEVRLRDFIQAMKNGNITHETFKNVSLYRKGNEIVFDEDMEKLLYFKKLLAEEISPYTLYLTGKTALKKKWNSMILSKDIKLNN